MPNKCPHQNSLSTYPLSPFSTPLSYSSPFHHIMLEANPMSLQSITGQCLIKCQKTSSSNTAIHRPFNVNPTTFWLSAVVSLCFGIGMLVFHPSLVGIQSTCHIKILSDNITGHATPNDYQMI